MTREEFDRYVNRIEAEAKERPGKVRSRTRALVFAGYVAIGAMVLLSVGLLFVVGFLLIVHPSAATIKVGLVFGIPLLIFTFSLLSSLWVRIGRPEGIPIQREDAPEVFALLDELSAAVGNSLQPESDGDSFSDNAPGSGIRFDEILVTPDFNAAVVQAPRLGIFGWYKRYLILGIPLMESVTPSEFKAVLAHEFGHLSGHHGKFGSWIYRTQATWDQLMMSLSEDNSFGARALRGFLGWFWPRFNGHAFALSRGQEYEADAFAADFAGADQIASALARIGVIARANEEAWEEFRKRHENDEAPPPNAYRIVDEIMNEPPDEEQARKWLSAALLRSTDTSDTHPSLTDRLGAVGLRPEDELLDAARAKRLAALPLIRRIEREKSAASHFFQEGRLDQLQSNLGLQWKESVADFWKMHQQSLAQAKEELEKLGELDPEASEEETISHLLRRMESLHNIGNIEEGEETAGEILRLEPNHPVACFVKGQRLLERGDEAGISFLERVIEHSPFDADACLDLLYQHYQATGNEEKLAHLKRQADSFDEDAEAMGKERNNFKAGDTPLSHGLSDSNLRMLSEIFAKHRSIYRVYAVRKKVEAMAQTPMYVFAIETKVESWKMAPTAEKLVATVLEEIEFDEAATYLVFTKPLDKKAFRRCVDTPGSLIYERQPKA